MSIPVISSIEIKLKTFDTNEGSYFARITVSHATENVPLIILDSIPATEIFQLIYPDILEALDATARSAMQEMATAFFNAQTAKSDIPEFYAVRKGDIK